MILGVCIAINLIVILHISSKFSTHHSYLRQIIEAGYCLYFKIKEDIIGDFSYS